MAIDEESDEEKYQIEGDPEKGGEFSKWSHFPVRLIPEIFVFFVTSNIGRTKK